MFVFEVDGTVSKVKIIKSNHELFTEEALRVFSIMPKWVPARVKDKPVRSY
ncbi:MAG: energy transducer TonB [Bacteroidota bacterium]|nr:energy transducer TonB [Bacteroidota bacterium]